MNDNIETFDLPKHLDAPYFEQYLGCWAMLPDSMTQLVEVVRNLNLASHLASPAAARAAERARNSNADNRGNVAIVSISGAMMKHVSSMSCGASTVLARRQIRAAARNDEIASIVLQIDSPGGTVAGTKDLGDDIAAAAKRKPVYAFIEDLGASAAYWIASQATKVYANSTALVGSIGTYGIVRDLSGLAAKEGVKVHVVRAGEFKGTGVAGTEVTPEQLAMIQESIDDLNSHFLDAVAAGRNLNRSQVEQLADGKAHIAAKAQELHLIDGMRSFDEVLSEAANPKSSRSRKQGKSMSENTVTTQVLDTLVAEPLRATPNQIRQHCKGADDSFVLAQIEAEATLDAAKTAFIANQSEQIATLTKDLGEARNSISSTASTGHTASTHSAKDAVDFSTSATDEWEEKVDAAMQGGKTRMQAVQFVNKRNPVLRQKMLAEVNR